MSVQESTAGIKILTIDDELIIRQSYRAFLEDLDYLVIEAESGTKGLEIFELEKPDLVLLDLTMPGMDGIEVLSRLKDKKTDTPIIVVSGTGRLSDIAQALRLGAWDYLFKPIHDLMVLQHAIGRSLERASLIQENKLYQQGLENLVVDRTKELKKSEHKYRTIFENLQDVYFETDTSGTIHELSPSIRASSGYNRDELLNTNIADIYINKDDRELFLELIQQQGKLDNFEILFKDKDKQPIHCSIAARIVTDEETKKQKICGSIRNINSRKLAEAALVESEEKYRTLVSNIPVGLYRYTVSSSSHYITSNQAMAKMLGYSSIDELLTTNPDDLHINPDDRKILHEQLEKENRVIAAETQVRKKDGSSIWTSITANVFRDEQGFILYIDAMIEDITERKDAEERIQHLSYYDFLTELPNRTMFIYRLKQALASSRRSATYGGVLVIDLDHFKKINDALGHKLGDMFLQEVAHRLRAFVRDEDTVARMGGDQFAMVFSDLSDSMEEAGRLVQIIAEKVRHKLVQPFNIDNNELFITVSIGISMFPGNSEDAIEILQHASTAVGWAKGGGRDKNLFYLPDMQQAADKRLYIEKELRQALAEDQFNLFYQPQVDSSGKIIGAEALIRWVHPERGIVSPADFIPIAEETGLILPIGDWVVQTACKHLKNWLDMGIAENLKYLSVNISPFQFRQSDFVDKIEKYLQAASLPPALLSIEITENIAIDNIEDTIEKMLLLKKSGISFSIDDFGTGYSSLSYLNQLPVDQLKIDRSFVDGLHEKSSFASIVSTIIVMAKSMGFSVVAEGVETKEELDFLCSKECSIFQGYYFSKPLPYEIFMEKLKQNHV